MNCFSFYFSRNLMREIHIFCHFSFFVICFCKILMAKALPHKIFEPKKLIFLWFSPDISILGKIWYLKWICNSLPFQKCIIYVTVKIQNLQWSINFRNSGLTPLLKREIQNIHITQAAFPVLRAEPTGVRYLHKHYKIQSLCHVYQNNCKSSGSDELQPECENKHAWIVARCAKIMHAFCLPKLFLQAW